MERSVPPGLEAAILPPYPRDKRSPTGLKPIFGPAFDDVSFGYREASSTKDALEKIWKKLKGGV